MRPTRVIVKWIIVLACMMLAAAGLQVGTAAEPAATQPASSGNVVEMEGTRLTLLGVSSGVAYVGEDDAFGSNDKAGDQKRHYVKAVFLKEGKGGVIGEFKINGELRKTIHKSGGTESKSIQVDHARAHWPAAGRMEKIPDHAKDTDVIFEETNFGVAPLPPKFSVSLDIGGRTFEFFNVSP